MVVTDVSTASAAVYDTGIPGCPGCPRRISSQVYMISVHRDVPGDRDMSISLKKSVEKLIIICQENEK